MTRFNQVLCAALVGAASIAAVQAKANPIYIAASSGNSGIVTLATGNGSAGVTGLTAGNYTISLSATGSPALANPNFGSNTLTIKATSGGTITLYASETGDTALVPSFNLGLSNNPLSDTTVTEAVYMSTTNQAYALSTMLGSAVLTPGQTVSINSALGATNTPYSITQMYTITFGAGGGTVDATILEKANVPEPMSLSLLGAGLAGLGFIRMRRNTGATA